MNIYNVAKSWVSILEPNNSEYFVISGWVPGKIDNIQ